ncbi:hypothetical protein [Brevundimonas sp.]|jgi:hypothetical protein|uniref:hypothetical protein n=1 Tax=Brevundimonas sp. TaxID=1871086 RepID=UPI00391D7C29|nr:hypothetical protein [Brevundimonas sp.]MCA3719189.1 hypothetical protein [Brevundimonas sp.]
MSLFALSLLLAAPSAGIAVEPAPVVAPPQARNVPVGDPLRRRLLDALRPAIQRDLGGQPVQFMVDRLRVEGDWAFFAGAVQQANGRPIDFGRTRYASALENGVFDGPGMFGLLRRSGQGWQVVTFVIGPTDVAWLAWSDEYGAPMSVFE